MPRAPRLGSVGADHATCLIFQARPEKSECHVSATRDSSGCYNYPPPKVTRPRVTRRNFLLLSLKPSGKKSGSFLSP